MPDLVLSPGGLVFVVGTRAALAFGMGLLVADRIPEARRKSLAMALIGVGAATTIPAVRLLFKGRRHQPAESADEFATEATKDELRTVADL